MRSSTRRFQIGYVQDCAAVLLRAAPILVALALTACTDGGDARVDEQAANDLPPAAARVDYVGAAVCGECHEDRYTAWSESAHAWAMKEATPDVAAALFDGRRVSWGRGATAIPLRQGEHLYVDVEEGSGRERHALTYFFGRDVIEQHVARFDGGRHQALPIGYDLAAGEWFDIFADEPRDPADWGYWKNPGMNANSECFFCHTTGYRKGYRVDSESYETSWAEAGVACEACHGPGAAHVEAARRNEGHVVYEPAGEAPMLDACASCHSLRREISSEYRAGQRFLDHFEPVLLDEADYHADGQLLAESYEWASFLQSRMYREGVTCGDCHDPHGGGLIAEGDALCLSCHDDALAAREHTHHPADSAGARCVSCHMPESTFMMRDRRRDHSLVIPDPALTVELGIPSACDRCHAAETPEWASARVEEWFGDGELREARRDLAIVFARARGAQATAKDGLLGCLDHCADPIRRASAAKLLLGHTASADVVDALVAAARDADALVRYGATWALAETDAKAPAVRAALREAAGDDLRAVRVNAGWGLRLETLADLPVHVRSDVEQAWADLVASLESQAEDPESHHALGLFYSARGDAEAAIAAYRNAVRLAPAGIPPRHNLAMLLGSLGRTGEAIEELEKLLTYEPRFAPASYALGLLYDEQERWREAIAAFTECLKAEPNYSGALHELAHAYVQVGEGDLANYVLEAALNYPGSRLEALRTLVSVNLELGRDADARRWATSAVAEMPDLAADPRVQDLLLGKDE